MSLSNSQVHQTTQVHFVIVEAEKLALVTPRSPCLTSSTTHTIQRQQTRPLPHTLPRPSTNEKKTLHVSSSNDESRDEHCRTSIVPIHRQQSRPPCTSTHTLPRRHHPNEIDTEDSYFPPMQTPPRRQNSNDFRKKIHGIYVLPVSPALSSSSSSTTTNTDEMNKASNSNTMPIRSLRHISSSIQMQKDTNSPRGIKNDCFADSPQTKDRTLPRSHGGTLRRVQPPAQPPPLPPPMAQFHMNHQQAFLSHHDDQTTFSHQSTRIDLDPDVIALRLSSQKIYGTKAPPPPVPCRTQKPTLMPIGFESFNTSSQSGAAPPPPLPPPPLDMIGFQSLIESSMQDDFVDHSWPKPPESMTTSEIGGPPPVLPPSIPYDRLNHDHLIPTVLMRQNQTNTFFQHHRFDGPNLFSESET